MRGFSFFILFIALLGVLVASQTLFVVKETERAVVLKFGEIVQDDVKPGIHFKLPIMNEVKTFDARILTMDSRPQRYLTLEKRLLLWILMLNGRSILLPSSIRLPQVMNLLPIESCLLV